MILSLFNSWHNSQGPRVIIEHRAGDDPAEATAAIRSTPHSAQHMNPVWHWKAVRKADDIIMNGKVLEVTEQRQSALRQQKHI